jgi:uncharacterized protein YcsI (UPF0317 family)
VIGCSFSFEAAMLEDGLPLRHVEMDVKVPVICTARIAWAGLSGRIDTTIGPAKRPAGAHGMLISACRR